MVARLLAPSGSVCMYVHTLMRQGGGCRVLSVPKITLLIRFVQQGNLVPQVTSHRKILYGPLHGALRCDIFPIFMAISMY